LNARDATNYIYARLPMLHVNPRLSKPLLLGGPGIGKSDSAVQSIVRLAFTALLLAGDGKLPFSNHEEMLQYIGDTLRRKAKVLAKWLVEREKGEGAERLCSCIRDAAKLALGAQPKTVDVNRVADALAKQAKAFAPQLYAELAHEYEWFNSDTGYGKDLRSGYKSMLNLIETGTEEGKWLSEYAASMPASLAAALLAEVVKPNAIRRLISIAYDSSLPVDLYIDATVHVVKDIGSTDITELVGVPAVTSSGGVLTTFVAPPKWAVALRKARAGLLVLDEFPNRAPDALRSLMFNLTLNTAAGSFFIGKPIVATGNTADTSSLVEPLPGPLFTGRLSVLQLDVPPVEEWMEYMDRTHPGWLRVIGEILRMTSSHSKSVERSAKEFLAENVGKKLAGAMGDTYYPPPQVLKKLSQIIPGRNTSFPSPRAWTSTVLVIGKYLDMYRDNPEQLRNSVYVEVNSLGMPLFAELLAGLLVSVADATSKGVEGVLKFVEQTLSIPKLVADVEQLLSGKSSNVVQVLTDLFRVIVAYIMYTVLVESLNRGMYKEYAKEIQSIRARVERDVSQLPADQVGMIVRSIVASLASTSTQYTNMVLLLGKQSVRSRNVLI